ncbi:hypothetical protein ACFUN7_18525 [Streptomyces sp. NPDC057236]|uniref:hypothetical protein n=1 Tax=Streptomyces sp. NPDC057236 TaxID=3346059 RepID=UPI003628FFD4
MSRVVALASGTAATAAMGYGAYTALGPPRIKHLTVPLTRLGPQAHGFRIALISDIHLNVLVGRSRTRQSVDLLNGTGPSCSSPTGPRRSRRPPGTGWTSSCPATPTAASSGPSPISRPW